MTIRPMGRIAALAAAMTMCFAASAHASTPNPLAVANAAWPGSPCSGQLRVLFDPAVGQRGHAGEATGIAIFPDGHVERSSCDMTLDPAVWAASTNAERCDIIVHEAGHLAGHDHYGTGVMNANGGIYVPCHPRLTPREAAKEFVRSTLPTRHGTRVWRVDCNPRATRCYAQAFGVRGRVYAVETDTDGSVATLLRMSAKPRGPG